MSGRNKRRLKTKGSPTEPSDEPPSKRQTRASSSSSNGVKQQQQQQQHFKTSDFPQITKSWEWEDDGNKWKPYTQQQVLGINKDFDQGNMNANLSTPTGTNICVKFDKMVQKNVMTGWERRIRCCIHDGNNYNTWQFETEDGSWLSYTVFDSLLLESHKQQGQTSVPLSVNNINYIVDLPTNKQINNNTKYSRNIRRAAACTGHPDVSVCKPAPPVVGTGDDIPNSTDQINIKQEPETYTVSKKKSGKAKAVKSKSKEPENLVKTVSYTGKAPVDTECMEKHGKAHVYYERNVIYDAKLNQTNLKNNNNKYYILQVLEDDLHKSYSVWFHWGRVGKKGQSKLTPCGPDLTKAKEIFEEKFHEKTKNHWDDKDMFEKIYGKYDLLEMDYCGDTEDKIAVKIEDTDNKPTPPSELDMKLQNLINLICDIKTMEAVVTEMKYDTKKAPLGKLTGAQIRAGYTALKLIETCLNSNSYGDKLIKACDDFYTRIPHDFGMTRPPVIKTKQELKQKLELLQALEDIEIALKVLAHETNNTKHPIDQHYDSLHCQIDIMDKDSETFQQLETYLQKTHAKTHNLYKMKIEDVFTVNRNGEDQQFVDNGNRMLLWHGSRLCNWASILSQGLKVAPPEAPVTGYMFGKGIYFADMSSKSANYCYPTRKQNTGLLLLCEVSLGDCNDLLEADYEADKLPHNKHSVRGLGRIAPDASQNKLMSDGAAMAMGDINDTGIDNPQGYTLYYNEYVVYDTKQIRMKYLFKVKFQFK